MMLCYPNPGIVHNKIDKEFLKGSISVTFLILWRETLKKQFKQQQKKEFTGT